ncbi:MAG: semialdehyde dehydrogenase [Bacteroides sp. SM23_62_1]|nr:MAG: semialdehyde dehydrogenase [Bacteroides sp. SM23_62_1]
MRKIAIVGAGGKMGCRITDNLKDSGYNMSYLEISPDGIQRLAERGISVSSESNTIPYADAVILAIPDVALGEVSTRIIPLMKSGAMVILLDPAVILAGKIYMHDDISYFVTHPAHPSVFNWEPTQEAQKDFFGGKLAKQCIVCALMQGDEKDYVTGEELARRMYAPVCKAYRITVEQMGLLEPALVETLSSTCMTIIREGLDEVIRLGVPAEAAREFLLGHLNIQLAVIFNELPGAVFSDAANKAISRGKPILFKEGWQKIFEPENVLEQVKDIT